MQPTRFSAEREQHQATESRQVTALRAEIADLRARLDERDQTIVRLADAIDILIDKTPTWVEKTIEGRVLKSEAEMCARIAESIGESPRLDQRDRSDEGAGRKGRSST